MEIPYQKIPRPNLITLLESFITREGTDYGMHMYSMKSKLEMLLRQLEKGKAIITFDPEDETFNLQPVHR